MLRAVDMALPMQRSTEMNQQQRGENRPEIQHQQFAQRLNKEQELQKQQVQKTPESEEAQIQKDGRGNSGGYGGGKGKKKGQKEEQKTPSVKWTSDSMFDITL